MTLFMTEPAASERTVPADIRHGKSEAPGAKNSSGRSALKWFLRLLVAGPAAAVSLQHVHETAQHFGQSGAMGWAEAIGMEAVTALALMELDESRHRYGTVRRRASLPWTLLLGAIILSLGSNVFAVLQQGGPSRSFGGVVYGGWPTLAFLAVAWLWHMQAAREVEAEWAGREQVPAPRVDVDVDDDEAPAPEKNTSKRASIRHVAMRELKRGHTPSPTAVAKEVGAVTPQYASRIIAELQEEIRIDRVTAGAAA